MSERNHWKTVAIIFIILFVLETAFIGWAIGYATDQDEKEKRCIVNICDGYPSYQYDMFEEICTCYDYLGEMQKEVYVLD